MSDRPQPQPGILKIAPYVPGKSGAGDGISKVKLSANESPLGASPKAIAAYRAFADRLEIYPEGTSAELRQALAEVHGIEADRIVAGSGSDEVLHLLAQTYLGEGDEAIYCQYGFSVYPIVIQGASATPVVAPEADYTASVDAILAAVTAQTRMIFLANPNNPTGTYLNVAELRRLQNGLRPDILLVIDSAYAEYVTAEDYSAGMDLVRDSQNTVMVRTFSKMGLAGVRVGWFYGPDHVVDAVNRLRGPFNVNVAAQAAGAAAARDTAFTQALCDYNAKWRDWLTAELSSNQLRVTPSQGNFILVHFPDVDGQRAPDAFQMLMNAGYVVREMGGYGLPNALRISIGSEEAMHAVARLLKNFGAE